MKNRYSKISILINLVCLIAIMIINYQIALRFLSSDAKTRLLFGMVELVYLYKYYIIIPILISSIFIAIGIKKKETKKLIIFSVVLNIITLYCLFLRFWALMI